MFSYVSSGLIFVFLIYDSCFIVAWVNNNFQIFFWVFLNIREQHNSDFQEGPTLKRKKGHIKLGGFFVCFAML